MEGRLLCHATHSIPSITVRSASNGHPAVPSSFLLLPSHRSNPPSLNRAIGLPPQSASPPRYRLPFLRHPGSRIPMTPASSAAIPAGSATELIDESDFDALVSSDGHLSVCGFGSLLSEKSARSTFPDLRNFRVAALRGFRRVFAHVAPIFFERGIAIEETGEVSSLSVEPCEGEFLIVTVFEISKSEVPAFVERENEFRFLAVVLEDLNGAPFTSPAVLCARYSDDEYFRIRCKGSNDIFFQRYGKYNIHRIWQDDILPCRIYLRH